MRLHFTIQNHQTEAVDSVTNVFAGQKFHNPIVYTLKDRNSSVCSYGLKNHRVEIGKERLLKNIQTNQAKFNISQSHTLSKNNGLGICTLDIEMETGTRKTYSYIKTMYELNKLYGWCKFIIVVPSIAIREGVKKSFESLQDHFMETYGKKYGISHTTVKNLGTFLHFQMTTQYPR